MKFRTQAGSFYPGRIFTISKWDLVKASMKSLTIGSDFIKANINFLLHFLNKKTIKNCENQLALNFKKYCFDV
jgi:hypothetical protein